MNSVTQPDVLVIGEALMDIVDTGNSATEHVGGSPANVALGLGRRGVRAALLTQLGSDPRGAHIAEHLEASGVEVLPSSFSALRTSTAVAAIGADGQAEYTFDVHWAELEMPVELHPRVLHTGSIAAFHEPGASSLRAILKRTGASEITFDPNIRPSLLGEHSDSVRVFEDTVKLATVVKMSDQDAAWLYPGLQLDEIVARVLSFGPRIAAITLGAEGAFIATAETRQRIPGVSVKAVDTIGAGDTFMASLIHSVLQHGSLGLSEAMVQQVGSMAVAAAAITVSRAGANLPWAAELPVHPAAPSGSMPSHDSAA
ncbi:carbohydrate kinase [Agromyces sp. MMS24-K17]|uniref:carbohydrate kinase family protein n=1 Tax=Agromyces sp. MMS24-K17 TaxID=3372850 RepID=UPI003754F05D